MLKCENVFCVYQNAGRCMSKKEIKINLYGMCENNGLIEIPDDVVAIFKNRTMTGKFDKDIKIIIESK